jgi:hypothetical protein
MSLFYQTGVLCQEPTWKNCNDPDHYPTYERIYVPPFNTYTHVCPACGYTHCMNTYNIRNQNEN